MERIMRLPLLLGFLAAVITGAVSYAAGVGNQTAYLRMAAMMLIFFLLGIFIRNTIFSLKNEVQIRKIEQKKRAEQELRRQREEQKAAEYSARFYPEKDVQSQEQSQDEVFNVKDYKTSGKTGDDFEPLTLSRAIKTKVNE
jgi:predicted membrane protein